MLKSWPHRTQRLKSKLSLILTLCEINQGIIKANNQKEGKKKKKEYPASSGNLQAEARKICTGKVNFKLTEEDND